MKNLKNVLTALAVVFAIGGAVASDFLLVTGYAKNPDTGLCEVRNNLPSDCSVTNTHANCTITFDAGTENAYSTSALCVSQGTTGQLKKP